MAGRPIRNVDDRGKGHAIKTGVAAAAADVMVQFDCDLQFFADDLPAVLAPVLRQECELALGSRFLKDSDRSAYQPVFFRDAGNRLLSAVISLLSGRRVTDATAGIKAWTRDAMERIDFRDDRFHRVAVLDVDRFDGARHAGDDLLVAMERERKTLQLPLQLGYVCLQGGDIGGKQRFVEGRDGVSWMNRVSDFDGDIGHLDGGCRFIRNRVNKL